MSNQTSQPGSPAAVVFPRRYALLCALLSGFVLVGFGAVLHKAFSLQVLEHEFWLGKARLQSETTFRIPVYRGSVLDRNGRLLATSVHQFSVFVDPSKVPDKPGLARKLIPIIELPAASIEAQTKNRQGFTWLKRGISDQQRNLIERLQLEGVQLSPEYQRFYPFGSLAGQLLGFTNVDGKGLEGIEKLYDTVLDKEPIDCSQLRDGARRRISLHDQGSDDTDQAGGITLSLDAVLQAIAERELGAAVAAQGARAAEAVIFDPRTMEVLALANWPPFDPYRYQAAASEDWRNRAITDLFEPGSTFKVFLYAAAIDQGTVRETDRFFCENGVYRLARNTIHDVHPHGWLTVPEMLMVSSNVGAAKLATKLGAGKFYQYIQAFGFGQKSGIGLTGEAQGLVRPWNEWRPIDLAVTGFGQSIGITALQLSSAVATIARGGVWQRPTILRRALRDSDQAEIRRAIQPARRVLKASTAALLTKWLIKATGEGGTGQPAVPAGYQVAGKTGTAQIVDPNTGTYSGKRYNAVFTGFVPAADPRLVITVVVHEPSKSIFGGTVAGPVFRNIAAEALPYLGVAPDRDDPNGKRSPTRWASLDPGAGPNNRQ